MIEKARLCALSAVYVEAASAASSFGDRLPVVGYEQADALSIARDLGFQSVGALRIWLSD